MAEQKRHMDVPKERFLEEGFHHAIAPKQTSWGQVLVRNLRKRQVKQAPTKKPANS